MLNKVFLNICFTSSQRVLQRNLPYRPPPGGVFLLQKKQPSPKELAKVQAKEMDLANEPGHKSLIILLMVLLLMEEILHHLGCIVQQDFSQKDRMKLSMICPDAPFQHTNREKTKHTGRLFTLFPVFVFGAKTGKTCLFGTYFTGTVHVVFPLGWYTYGFWMA